MDWICSHITKSMARQMPYKTRRWEEKQNEE